MSLDGFAYLADYAHPDFIFMIPLLVLIGVVAKHLTDLNNGLIPFLLIVIAVVGCSVWGYQISAFAVGEGRWFDAIVRSGLAQGFLLAAIAGKIYNTVHGAKKTVRELKMKKSKEVSNG